MYTHAVLIQNEIWGSLKPISKSILTTFFATILKMVFAHYILYLDKVHLIHLIRFTVERERERGREREREEIEIERENYLDQ